MLDVVELVVSALLPRCADEPPGAPAVSPDAAVGAPAAASLCVCVLAPRTDPEDLDKSEDNSSPVTHTGVPFDFFTQSWSVSVLDAVSVLKLPWFAEMFSA